MFVPVRVTCRFVSDTTKHSCCFVNYRGLAINPDFVRLRFSGSSFGFLFVLIHSLLRLSLSFSFPFPFFLSPLVSPSVYICIFFVSSLLCFPLYQRSPPLALAFSGSSIPPLSLSSRRGTICPEADICKLTRLDGKPPRISFPIFLHVTHTS